MPERYIHGSYAITAFCKDGIVMAADTRSSFVNPTTNEELAYFDQQQKVFIVHDYIMTFTGSGTISNRTIKSIIEEYNTEPYKKDEPINKSLTDFLTFIQKKYPNSLSDINNINIAIAKYIDGKPVIANMTKGNYQWGSANPDGKASISSDPTETFFKNIYDTSKGLMSCKEVAKIATKAIYLFASERKKETSIGGTIEIVKMTPNNKPIWLVKEENQISYLDIKDFRKKYFNGQLKMVFLSDEKKQEFENIVSTF